MQTPGWNSVLSGNRNAIIVGPNVGGDWGVDFHPEGDPMPTGCLSATRCGGVQRVKHAVSPAVDRPHDEDVRPSRADERVALNLYWAGTWTCQVSRPDNLGVSLGLAGLHGDPAAVGKPRVAMDNAVCVPVRIP